jgi:hypothetical protein
MHGAKPNKTNFFTRSGAVGHIISPLTRLVAMLIPLF